MDESTDIRGTQDSQGIQGIQELLAGALQGNRVAEERLFNRLHARILAVAKRRVRDQEAARDIAQETMQTVFEKYRSADLPRGLLPWVFVVLRNKVGNYLKRSRAEAQRRITVEDTWMAEVVGLSPDGERAAFDLVREVEIALARATAECRAIFRLLLSGAGRHEIQAAFDHEPLGTVDSRISRCRRKLVDAIERAEVQATVAIRAHDPGRRGHRGEPAGPKEGPHG